MAPSRGTAGADLPNLFGLDREGLQAFLRPYDIPRYHADQIYRWLYRRDVLDAGDWTDLPKSLRATIAGESRVAPGRVSDRATAADGTVKYRVDLDSGGSVEAVYMVHDGRVTLCLSSQVGCALDCKFCLTGRMGLQRHLGVGEILGQVTLIRRDRSLGERPFNVVFMGMGEPLHNYDAVIGAIRVLTDEDGFGLSRRRITVSTSGLVPGIERLAREPARPRLAVSLNATTDADRLRLMPITRKYPIRALIDSCRDYARATGEPFTFEYVLLQDINDRDEDLARLPKLVRGLPAKINLIPFNAVEGWLPYRPPSERRVLEFRDALLERGVRVSVRWSKGGEARAACGQLALLDGTSPAKSEVEPTRRGERR